MLVVFMVLGCLLKGVLAQPNNVCPSFKDYYTVRENPKCWYDLSAEFTAPEIIKLNGYPVVEYNAQTQDGYILTLYRIPSSSTNPNLRKHPIYLQHGLVATCANFIALGKNSLAFLLSDAGYDVWLGNYRGNNYSEGHVNLTVYDQEYWDHSLDEVVLFDFPAIFATILRHSPPYSQIIYVGHSLGTTLALMYNAEFPDVGERQMKMAVLMSPAYTLANMISPYKLAAPFGNAIVNTVRQLGMLRIVSQAGPLRSGVARFCMESPPLMQFCMQLYNLFYGPNTQLGTEAIPVYFNQLPGGTALKILNHAADLVLGNFRRYNYVDENYKYYGTLTPPVYDIKKIRIPIHLIYSTQDWATTEADALNLYKNLPDRARSGMTRIDLPNFNHIDFVFGRNARGIVYENLIGLLNKAVDA